MTKDEALKMAIEALDNACMKIEKWTKGGKWTAGKEASAKCKEVLEQPAQEPVAWIEVTTHHEKYQTSKVILLDKGIKLPHDTPLYTHPAPSWQGLSDDDAIIKLAEYHGVDSLYETGVLDFAHAIEQALKEKNYD